MACRAHAEVGADVPVQAVRALQIVVADLIGRLFEKHHVERGLVALELVAGLVLVADEAVVALEHEDGSIDERDAEHLQVADYLTGRLHVSGGGGHHISPVGRLEHNVTGANPLELEIARLVTFQKYK